MINTNGKFELLRDKHGMPIGAFKKAKYKDYELTFKKGDSIFLYTDGVAEATDADVQLFGTDRTLAALNENPDAAPEELLKNVRVAVDAFVKDLLDANLSPKLRLYTDTSGAYLRLYNYTGATLTNTNLQFETEYFTQ